MKTSPSSALTTLSTLPSRTVRTERLENITLTITSTPSLKKKNTISNNKIGKCSLTKSIETLMPPTPSLKYKQEAVTLNTSNGLINSPTYSNNYDTIPSSRSVYISKDLKYQYNVVQPIPSVNCYLYNKVEQILTTPEYITNSFLCNYNNLCTSNSPISLADPACLYPSSPIISESYQQSLYQEPASHNITPKHFKCSKASIAFLCN